MLVEMNKKFPAWVYHEREWDLGKHLYFLPPSIKKYVFLFLNLNLP